MPKKITILISSAGRRNALIASFRAAAARMDTECFIIATDMRPLMSPACHAADLAISVPHCLDPSFEEKIKAICTAHRVNLLVPTIDTELPFFANNVGFFNDNGVFVAISSPQVVNMARDKLKFLHFLTGKNISAPNGGSASLTSAQLDALPWPCIFKPRDGSRSIGIVRANTPNEVPENILNEKYIWQEYWRGKEFTINFFINRFGQCKCVIPHERVEVRDGEVSKGITRRIPAIEQQTFRLAEQLSAIGARGALCVQAIARNDDKFIFFELNARFGGGYPLAHNAGAHFAQWLIEDTFCLPSTANNDWTDGRVMLRFDDACFFDEPHPENL
ncbi:MAG: ATP-grasp domain-containing protein [Puniceicoccales bacterium]|jgi:carbamoyl-phosphate synthase large subunit|nr:ATP-grasp domain-containing protein [Puniceicoccales bacterium]